MALVVETSVIYGRRILRGISRYLRRRHGWSIFLEQRELGAPPPRWLSGEKWDGIISRPTDPRLAEVFRRMKVPVVDLNDLHESLGFPRIVSDNRAIGRLGAEHLLERGIRRFGFCGFSREPWSAERRDGFVDAVRAAGGDCDMFESLWRGRRVPTWDDDQRDIMSWIGSLPRPAGIMTCNDVRGLHVINAAALLGIAVPEELAVIGVDNEVTFCELCDPPLSSVAPDPDRIGFEAAALLEALMNRRRRGTALIRVPPLGVVQRQSTNVLAMDDPVVAAALRYIREQALHGCKVGDVLRRLPLSRSALERRFRKSLNRSPQEQIRQIQVERIRRLLVETDLKLPDIAALCGFEHPEYMNVMFKRITGQTPGRFRRARRGPSPDLE